MKYFWGFSSKEFTVQMHFLNSYLSVCQGKLMSEVTVLKIIIIIINDLYLELLSVYLLC